MTVGDVKVDKEGGWAGVQVLHRAAVAWVFLWILYERTA